MTLSRRLRFEILRRDGYTCRYCGASAPDAVLTVDHVIPVTLGGGDEPNNLATACHDCNAGKSSSSPDQSIVEEVDAAALLFAKAMERAAAMQRKDRRAAERSAQRFLDAWCKWETPAGDHAPLDPEWRDSHARFLERGLTEKELFDAVLVAMNKTNVSIPDKYRYFCGCCWRALTDRIEMARRLIEDGEV